MSRPAARCRRRSPPRTRRCRCRRRPRSRRSRLSAFSASSVSRTAVDGRCDRLRALLVGRQVLRAAVIGLQPAECEPRRIGDAARERRRVLARRDAAALHADVDLDQRAQLDAEVLRDARGRIDLLGGVEAQRDRRILRERGKAAQLAITDDLIAHQDVRHAAAHQRFRLADLLHALADRALRDLPQRDRRRLVRLGMRAHAHAGRARKLGHFRDVAIERVEIDDQRRRIDVCDRSTDLGGRRVHRFTGKRWGVSIFMAGRACPCPPGGRRKRVLAIIMSHVPRISCRRHPQEFRG